MDISRLILALAPKEYAKYKYDRFTIKPNGTGEGFENSLNLAREFIQRQAIQKFAGKCRGVINKKKLSASFSSNKLLLDFRYNQFIIPREHKNSYNPSNMDKLPKYNLVFVPTTRVETLSVLDEALTYFYLMHNEDDGPLVTADIKDSEKILEGLEALADYYPGRKLTCVTLEMCGMGIEEYKVPKNSARTQ